MYRCFPFHFSNSGYCLSGCGVELQLMQPCTHPQITLSSHFTRTRTHTRTQTCVRLIVCWGLARGVRPLKPAVPVSLPATRTFGTGVLIGPLSQPLEARSTHPKFHSSIWHMHLSQIYSHCAMLALLHTVRLTNPLHPCHQGLAPKR